MWGLEQAEDPRSFDTHHCSFKSTAGFDRKDDGVHDDPLYATALAASQQDPSLALNVPRTEDRLALPTSWNNLGFPDQTFPCPAISGSMYGPAESVSTYTNVTTRSAPAALGKCNEKIAIEPTPAALHAAEILRFRSTRTRPRVPCDIAGCDLTFPRTWELNRHKTTVHGLSTRHYHCGEPTCEYHYGRADKVRHHCRKSHRHARGNEHFLAIQDGECTSATCRVLTTPPGGDRARMGGHGRSGLVG